MFVSELLEPLGAGWMRRDDPGEIGSRPKFPRGGVSIAEQELLRDWCSNKDVLEIGTGIGLSSRAIASSCHWLHTVDIDPWVVEVIHGELSEFPNVSCYEAIPPGLVFDVAFIDGDHNAAGSDVEAVLPLIRKGGSILVHDWNHIYRVRHDVSLVREPSTVIATDFGIGVICV